MISMGRRWQGNLVLSHNLVHFLKEEAKTLVLCLDLKEVSKMYICSEKDANEKGITFGWPRDKSSNLKEREQIGAAEPNSVCKISKNYSKTSEFTTHVSEMIITGSKLAKEFQIMYL